MKKQMVLLLSALLLAPLVVLGGDLQGMKLLVDDKAASGPTNDAGDKVVDTRHVSAARDVKLFPFAAAFPPRAQAAFPTEEWLEAIHKAGYTHVILQCDPFYRAEMDSRVSREYICPLLSVFDMVQGPSHGTYQAWLGTISERAGRHGLRLGMELWEPFMSQHAWQVLPPDWKGSVLNHRGCGYSNNVLCASNPQARAWLMRGFQSILRAAPGMDMLVLGINDNAAALCSKECPRCISNPLAQRLGELYRDIQSACREVRPDFRFIPYNWFWSDSYYNEILSRLGKGTPILARLEAGAPFTPDPAHPEWTGSVSDQSLACDEIGPIFQKAKQMAARFDDKLLVMPTLSGMFEAFELPYVPALGQVARKFDHMRSQRVEGWVDYDDGGIHEGLILDLVNVVQHNPEASCQDWIRMTAELRYASPAAVHAAIAAWESWGMGVRALPTLLRFNSIYGMPGRWGVAMSLTPMHPFLPEQAKLSADSVRDDHGRYYFDPHNFITREVNEPVRHCLERAIVFGREGLDASRQVVEHAPSSHRANAERDAAIAELTLLVWQSNANFYEWAAAVQGDHSVSLSDVIRSEIQVTRRYKELQSRPELEVGNMVYIWQRVLSLDVPEATTDHSLVPLKRRFPEQMGEWYEWKIKSLEKQLAEQSGQ